MTGTGIPVDTGAGRNWAGSHTYQAGRYVVPRDVDDLRAVVAESDHVRVLGTRHAFNDGCDTEGTLVSLARLEETVVVDATQARADISAAIPYARLASALHERGWALPNTGSLPHIGVAGAVSTGTHGSGAANQVLAAAVDSVTSVLGDGSLRTVRRGETGFEGCVVALGATGVVVGLGLALEPTYDVVQEVRVGLSWSDLLSDPAAVLRAGYSVSVFTRWGEDPVGEVLLKRRAEPGTPATATAPDDAWLGRLLPHDVASPLLGGGDNLTARGAAGPWFTRLPHFRHDREPGFGDELQSEWFVPLDQAAGALAAVRAEAAHLAPLLKVTELRAIAADDLWLSGAQGRDTLALHFTWRNRLVDVLPVVGRVEAALAPFDARPHWGKVFTPPVDIDRLYPRAEDFRRQRRALDPDEVFVNGYLRRLGLV